MKNYTVKTLKNFNDKEDNVFRVKDSIFECTKERYEFLEERNAVELVKIKEEKVEKEVKKKTTKKSIKK